MRAGVHPAGRTLFRPVTIVSATLILTAVAMLAALIPAKRTARVDPMTALRVE